MTSRASWAARTLGVLLALALPGCSDAAPDPGASDAAAGDHGAHDESHDEAHDEESLAPHTEVGELLLAAGELPPGYRLGHAHGAEPTGDEPTSAGCRPLAELLRPSDGTRHGGHADHGAHDAATVSFARSHVGPTVSQTVVDVGGAGPAAAEVRRLEGAATACREYVQSTSSSGANTYSVAALRARDGAPPGLYLRLTATDPDFSAEAIHWDLWVHHCAAELVAVSFRSVPSGGNADFWAAVSSAADRLRQVRSGAC